MTSYDHHARLVRSNRRRGFTLTEIAIVLGIAGIVLAAIWVAAGQLNEKARVGQAVNEFNVVAQNMSTLLQSGYGSNAATPPCGAVAPPCDLTSAMFTAGVIPALIQKTVLAGGTDMGSNPWISSGLTMQWVKGSVAGDPGLYRISFYGVITMDGCIGLINQATSCTPTQPGCPIEIMTVGESPALGYSTPSMFFSTKAAPPTSAMIQTMCNGNFTSGAGFNSVEFDFSQ